MRNPFGVRVDCVSSACTFSNPGSDIQALYELVKDDLDQEVLVQVGQQSVSTLINSWSDLTDMSYILSRLNAGDASVLNVMPNAFYGDVTDMPHDHRAALTAIQNARTYFDNLPEETRAKFDDSFENWFGDAGSESWISRMIKQSNEPVEAPTTEVSNES